MPKGDIRLDLPEEAVEELMALANASEKLATIVEASSHVGPQVGTWAVARLITGKVGIPVSELRRLVGTLLNIYHTQLKLKVDTRAAGAAIASNLRRMAKTPEGRERVGIWEAAQGKVVEAISRLHPDHPLEASYKAYQVASASQYELVRMKIFTDIRPVFNVAGDSILQSVVSHVLSLDYHDGHSHRVIQFTLDASDVSELRQLCERAERKAGVIKRDLSDVSWPTTIFREPTDSDASAQ